MRVSDNQPQRLGLGKVDPSSREARAGAFLREALDVAELSAAEIADVRARLAASASGRRPRRLLVPAFAAFGVLFVTGGVLAALGTFHRRPTPAPTTPTAKTPRASHARVEARANTAEPVAIAPPAEAPAEARSIEISLPESRRPTVRPSVRRAPESRAVAVRPSAETQVHAAIPSDDAIPAPVATLAPVGATVSRPAPAAAVAPTPTVEPAPAPTSRPVTVQPSAAGAEARSLAEALERWRRQGRADAALSLLDEHDRRFPRGLLHVESRVARAEILLALGRTLPALGVLDGLNLSGLPRSRELETLRGDLRAQAGRCSDARADLNTVLKLGRDDELGRRAARALRLCP